MSHEQDSWQINSPKRPLVVHAGTSSLSLRLMRGQLAFLREAGFEVMIITSPGEELEDVQQSEGVETVGIRMAREISPWQDLVSLWHFYRILSRRRPAITNVGTPKAGLLGGIAAWLSGVPCRFYTLRGLRCETTSGVKFRVLRLTERVACGCAHRVICVSQSLRRRAIELGIVDPQRAIVLASGSSNGVDAERFTPNHERLTEAANIRQELNIPPEAPIVGFVSRLTRDKGIVELVQAFLQLSEDYPSLRLLLVGEFEDGDPVPAEVRREIENNERILRTGFIRDAAPYYHLMDVLALPSYREGFPNSVLEAHAAGKPVVATRATGAIDSVNDGVDGFLVPVGDADALGAALMRLLKNKALAEQMGRAGREKVVREFRPESVWSALEANYLDLLRAKGLGLPELSSRDKVRSSASTVESSL
jgi:glycosyltransferase involved in cell wall biosynthesis